MTFSEFIEILNYPFVRRAYIAIILISILCSLLGHFLVIRRSISLTDGLAHSMYGTTLIAILLQTSTLFVTIPTIIIVAILLEYLSGKESSYRDTTISLVSVVFMSLGLVISKKLDHGDLTSLDFLFGNVLLVNNFDIYALFSTTLGLLITIYIFYWDFLSVSFDNDYAQTTKIRKTPTNYIINLLVALIVIFCTKIVGSLLVTGLCIIPSAISFRVSKNFLVSLINATIISVILAIAGMTLSIIADIPTSAAVVLFSFCTLLLIRIWR